MQNRRQFLKASLAGVALGAGLTRLPEAIHASPGPLLQFPGGRRDSWDALPQILERIRPPQFPEREFVITQFGAVGDNATDCTEAFRKAIEACHAGGGVEKMNGQRAKCALYLRGFKKAPIEDVRLVGCRFEQVADPNVIENVKGLELVDVTINGKPAPA